MLSALANKMKPLLAIIGRPNVGKSTIFNRLTRSRHAVVSDIPGTTRDKIEAEVFIDGHPFIAIDTGGIQKVDKHNEIEIGMMEQTEIAINLANIIILVLDGQVGFLQEDRSIIKKLQREKKCFIVVVNKVDSHVINQDVDIAFSKSPLKYLKISAIHNIGFADFKSEIIRNSNIVETSIDIPKDKITISLVGKPNVGKSSIMNAITGKKVSIVSAKAGTTRDSIDTDFNYRDYNFKLVDTAGLRRKTKIDDQIEYYSYLRAVRSLQRSEISILVIDATEPISHYEKSIMQLIQDGYKGCVLVVNKWDLIEKDTSTMDHYTKYLRAQMPFASWVPIVFTSAINGQRLNNILDRAILIYEERRKKIKTSLLNDILEELKMLHAPRKRNSTKKDPKLYFIAQAYTNPPTFKIQVNDKKNLHNSYSRYLENKLRNYFGFLGTPIKIILVSKKKRLK